MAKATNLEFLLNAYWNNYAGILTKSNEANDHTHYLKSVHEINHYAKVMGKVYRRAYPRGQAFRRLVKLRDAARERRALDTFF